MWINDKYTRALVVAGIITITSLFLISHYFDAPQRAADAIRVSYEKNSFGELRNKSPVEPLEFVLQNVSNRTVDVESVTMGCGCMQPNLVLPAHLAPFGSIVGTVQLDPNRMQFGHHAYDMMITGANASYLGRASYEYEYSPPLIGPSGQISLLLDTVTGTFTTRLEFDIDDSAKADSFAATSDDRALGIELSSGKPRLSGKHVLIANLFAAANFAGHIANVSIASVNNPGSQTQFKVIAEAMAGANAELEPIFLGTLRVGDTVSRRVESPSGPSSPILDVQDPSGVVAVSKTGRAFVLKFYAKTPGVHAGVLLVRWAEKNAQVPWSANVTQE